MPRSSPAKHRLYQHLSVILLSIVFAVWLVQTGEIEKLLESIKGLRYVGSIGAGMLFTSVFTTAPSIVILGQIAHTKSILEVALLGGLGAMIGDLIIFRFIKNDLSGDFKYILAHSKFRRLKILSRARIFRWLVPFLGALVIASPLPDELGLAMLGFSRLKTIYFIPISFTFNFLGILLIGYIANIA
jgi:hypothetical protein